MQSQYRRIELVSGPTKQTKGNHDSFLFLLKPACVVFRIVGVSYGVQGTLSYKWSARTARSIPVLCLSRPHNEFDPKCQSNRIESNRIKSSIVNDDD
mmetsp:Transcript_7710/g.15056  ORF Transcript_7710/g.15056 Transcript_7710/m.15056 type:complete len:97 (+) Transcript_7710:769-1059(+)